MTKMNMVQAINTALSQEMTKDKDVVLLGEDVGRAGGVFRVTDGLKEKFGVRVIDTPLAELGIVGTAVGMAALGLKPVAEIQFSGFVYGAYDELISHASRLRNRTRGTLSCPMVLRTPYGGGIRALEHHSESMEAIYAHTPGLKVVIPSRPYDAKGLLIASIRDPDPVIFMEPKRVYRAIKEEVPDEEYEIPLGKANVIEEGDQLTLIAHGSMIKTCLETVSKMDESVEVIDLRTIYPLDTKTIIDSVKKTGRVVIVHEAPQTCGIGAEIIARINEKAFTSLEAPVKRVAGFDTVFPLSKMENHYLPDELRIKSAITEVLKY